MKYVYAIVAVVLMAGAASAGPVLLGSFDRYGGSGSTGITDPRVQLGINVLSINDLPDSVSLDDYGYVLVHCVPFDVTFAYAELK